jgi:hypothetical protein
MEWLSATLKGYLLIYFRNPLPHSRAQLVSLKNSTS